MLPLVDSQVWFAAVVIDPKIPEFRKRIALVLIGNEDLPRVVVPGLVFDLAGGRIGAKRKQVFHGFALLLLLGDANWPEKMARFEASPDRQETSRNGGQILYGCTVFLVVFCEAGFRRQIKSRFIRPKRARDSELRESGLF